MGKTLKLPTLLVICDNPTIRLWVKKHLDTRFFLLFARSKKEILKALDSPLDFVIVDAKLDDDDPLKIIREISKDTIPSGAAIFLITGRLKKSYREKARSCGVSDFLSDQLDEEELFSKIKAGEKNLSSREKTRDLVQTIKAPKAKGEASWKKKIVFEEKALTLIEDAKKKKFFLSLLIIELDPPSEELFSFLKKKLRPQDVLTKIPDDCWALILSNAPLDKGKIVAEKLKKALEKKAPSQTKISIAIKQIPPGEKEIHKIVQAALKSLKNPSETL